MDIILLRTLVLYVSVNLLSCLNAVMLVVLRKYLQQIILTILMTVGPSRELVLYYFRRAKRFQVLNDHVFDIH
jgi:hypothetical protein